MLFSFSSKVCRASCSGDGARALRYLAHLHRQHDRADDAQVVHAVVLEEAGVLLRGQGLDEMLRHLVQLHGRAVHHVEPPQFTAVAVVNDAGGFQLAHWDKSKISALSFSG